MATQLYTAKHRKYTQNGHITPGAFKQDGFNPTLGTVVAPYLPLVRYSKHDEDWMVISQGKLVAFDSYGYTVPAGYALDLALEVATPGTSVIAYTQDDEDESVVGPDGALVQAGDKLAPKLVSAGVTISEPFAVAGLSFYRSSSDEFLALNAKRVGKGGALPIEWRYHNYNPQTKLSFYTDYVLEVGVVSSYDPPFKGMVAFDAQAGSGLPYPGAKVKCDINSNFRLWVNGVDDESLVVGQILEVDLRSLKGYLKNIQTVFGEGTGGGAGTDFDTLDALPGSASEGLSDTITYVGGSAALGVVQINLTRF